MRILFLEKQIDYEPLGVMHISSVLKHAGHEVDLVIANQEDPIKFALSFHPDILAYSVTTGCHNYYLKLNRQLRQKVDALSIFGGPHATFFPNMIEEEGVDALCVGEGEKAMLGLVSALAEGRSISDIPNWWIKIDGEIRSNPVRRLVDNLDEFPAPDRELVYSKHRVLRESKIKHFITGRGCPYDCSYCFNHAYYDRYRGNGRRVRQRSVDSILAEVADVAARYPLEFVVFLDDTFILNRRWLAEFAEKYPRKIGLPFFCNVRANLVTPDLVKTLKWAGCASVGMGIETGDDELRNRVLKRNMSKDQIISACKLIRSEGIHLISTNMLGLPGGSLAADFETLDLNIRCRPSYANTFLFQPYPGTELGEYARSFGYTGGTFDDIDESAWERSVLKFGSKTEKRRIETLQKLFALTVEFPWLLPLTKLLVKIPNNGLYWLAHKLWKGYAIKKRIHPHHLSPREYVQTVAHYMKLD